MVNPAAPFRIWSGRHIITEKPSSRRPLCHSHDKTFFYFLRKRKLVSSHAPQYWTWLHVWNGVEKTDLRVGHKRTNSCKLSSLGISEKQPRPCEDVVGLLRSSFSTGRPESPSLLELRHLGSCPLFHLENASSKASKSLNVLRRPHSSGTVFAGFLSLLSATDVQTSR